MEYGCIDSDRPATTPRIATGRSLQGDDTEAYREMV